MFTLPELSKVFAVDQIVLTTELIKIAIVTLASYVLSLHYTRFARVLSNRQKFARVLMFMAMTTMLVITVVKSSLALSLGLVGALSIIRFRTPVKEPEELAYLFLAIAIGIGIGANQIALTVVVAIAILLVMSLSRLIHGTPPARAILNIQLTVDNNADQQIKQICELSGNADLRRADVHDNTLNLTLMLNVKDSGHAADLVATLRNTFPSASLSLVEKDSTE